MPSKPAERMKMLKDVFSMPKAKYGWSVDSIEVIKSVMGLKQYYELRTLFKKKKKLCGI